jgi:vacuolar-type H+-ATPase subunit I/STV1
LVEEYDCNELIEMVSTLSIHLDRKIKDVNQQELDDYIYVLADFSKKISDYLGDLKKIGTYLQKNRDCRKELKILKKWISEANNFKESMNNYADGLGKGEYNHKKFLRNVGKTINRFEPTFNQIYQVFGSV